MASRTKPCPVCGETIKIAAKKCIYCNELFEEIGGSIWPKWTGFRGKTFWDLLSLIGIPLLLVWIGIMLTQSQSSRQFNVEATRTSAQSTREADRTRENALQAYFDQMTELLLNGRLHESDVGDEVRSLARSRTLTVLRGLDPERKRALLLFLQESGLISTEMLIIDLREAELIGIKLNGTDLNSVDLSETNLTVVDLRGAKLLGADLNGANLSGADLEEANLSEANLSGANLGGTNLSSAILHGVQFDNADLTGAELKFADLSGARLDNATLLGVNLRDVRYNDATIWPSGFDPTKVVGAINLDS